jgi:hypothetical protein
MSNDLSILEGAVLPDFVNPADNSLAEAAIGGIGGGQAFPRISIKGSRWRIVEDGVSTPLPSLDINAVVVGANPHVSRMYFSGAYDEDEARAPDCWSDDGVRPDPAVSTPQCSLCARCPNSVWGSKISPAGKKTLACGNMKRISVVSSDAIGGTVYELIIPGSSTKNFQKYIKNLGKFPLNYVVTNMSFDPEASYPLIEFKPNGFLTQDEYAMAEQIKASPLVKEITRAPSVPPAPPTEAELATAPPPVDDKAPPAAPAAAAPAQAAPQAPENVVPFGGTAPAPAPAAAPEPAPAASTGGFGAPQKPAGFGAAPQQQPAPDLAPASAAADISAFENEIDAFLNGK